MGNKWVAIISFPSVLMAVFVLITAVIAQEDDPKLKLINVVFRHGDRTPDTWEMYPSDPHLNASFYPVGRGGMTNAGKLRSYRLGQELKSRYGDFLGPIYEPTSVEARSTDYDRTKMSLQLVLSGLYPPAAIQKWNDELPWQPIPASYKPLSEDILFEPELCPKYLVEFDRVKASPEVLNKTARYKSLMKYLETHTGRPYENTSDILYLHHTFAAEMASNLPLPDWVAGIFPYGELREAALLDYDITSYNQNLKRLNGGMFVRKISEDLTAYRSGTLPVGRRVYLYSGHETNIAALLIALGIFEPHAPHYSSAIIVELWQSKVQYFVKVLYYTGIPAETVTMKIPGCAELCPLDTFLELMRSVTPSDSDLICVKGNTGLPIVSDRILNVLRRKPSL